MKSTASSVDAYIESLPQERKKVLRRIREVILENLPEGFSEEMAYGMIGYVVPLSVYPSGYHCDAKQPLPFMNLASQKNYIALYHMGIYADKDLLEWFKNEFPNHSKRKPDLGKSCIRFKNMEDIPYKLIGELTSKMEVQDWISLYKTQIRK